MIKQSVDVTFRGKSISVSVLRKKRGPRWIVLLHGLQTNKRQFLPVFSSDAFEDFSLLAVDLVGFGKSAKPDWFSYSLDHQLEVVLKLLDDEGITKFSVIGHSMGGMLGTMMLGRVPDRVEGIVSLEGNLVEADCGESLTTSQLSPEAFADAYEDLKVRIQNDGTSGAIRYFFLETTPAFVFYQASKAIVDVARTGKLKATFENAKNRKLLIVGERSKFVSRPEPIRFIKGTGHFMLIEKTRETLDELANFFGGRS